jgi:hypothetical protein
MVDKPPKKERPIPEMKLLVPLPQEWMRALEGSDPKMLEPLEPVPVPLLPAHAPNVPLVVTCVVVGCLIGYACFKTTRVVFSIE